MAREESIELASSAGVKEGKSSLEVSTRQSFTSSGALRTISSADCGVWKLALWLFLFFAIICLGFAILWHHIRKLGFEVTPRDRVLLAEAHEKWSPWLGQCKSRRARPLSSVNTFLRMLNAQLLPKDLVVDGTFFPPKVYDVQRRSDMSTIGKNNWGIYSGRRTSDGEEVVIKVVHEELAADGEGKRESRLAAMYDVYARLQLVDCLQGNLLGYLEVSFPAHEGYHFWLTEVMVNYGSSATVVYEQDARLGTRPRSFDVSHKTAIVAGALRAVVALQEAGFVSHGDVQPSNILLPPKAEGLSSCQLADAVRLIDYESAIHQAAEIPNFVRFGKIYGAPEQYNSSSSYRTVFDKVDVFSCGATLVKLLTGKSIRDLTDAAGLLATMTSRRKIWHHAVSTFSENFLGEAPKQTAVLVAPGGFLSMSLLIGMLEPDPARRWGPKKALTEVMKFCCSTCVPEQHEGYAAG